jgi:monoamine oxidase
MICETIIIGAGISGLTIAAGLDNPDFLILEARDRIGGRVFTNKDTHLDMGAAWIHGSIDNPLNKYLDYDRDMIQVAPKNPWIHSENAQIQYMTNSGKMSELVRQQMAAKWRDIVGVLAKVEGKSIAQAYADLAFTQVYKANDKSHISSFLYLMEVWCGGSLANIPTSYLSSSPGDYPGSHCLFKQGASTLVDAIVADSKHNILTRVRYNQVVTDIIYGKTGVEVVVADGSNYFCERLCITLPPGPLLNIRFLPPLSEDRIAAISQIKMGSYKKIQLEFDSVFWADAPMLLICDGDKYTLWNNYMCSKNKPIIEAVCPADIGWGLSGHSDEEIVDTMMTNLRTFYPGAPEPVA